MGELLRNTKVAAAVILYNPGYDVLENLYTYINQVGKIYVIDNSDFPNKEIVDKIKEMNTDYVCNGSNIGIAAALNIAAKKAIADKFEYLLTMDQDSKVSIDLVECLYPIAKSSKNIGIVVGEYVNPDYAQKQKVHFTKEILYTMNSGNLISLSAFKEVGEYWEELFIDHVDHEYCLRMNLNGYKVIKTNKTFIYHKVGNVQIKKIFFLSFSPSYHSPLRLYYRTRNRFHVNQRYKKDFPGYIIEDRWHMIREIVEIILFEPKVIDKMKMMLKGYFHYRKRILGKYNDTKI